MQVDVSNVTFQIAIRSESHVAAVAREWFRPIFVKSLLVSNHVMLLCELFVAMVAREGFDLVVNIGNVSL